MHVSSRFGTTSGYGCSLWHTSHVQHRGEGVAGAACTSPTCDRSRAAGLARAESAAVERLGCGLSVVWAAGAAVAGDCSPGGGSVEWELSEDAIAPSPSFVTRAASADKNCPRVMLPSLSAQQRKMREVAALRDDSAFSNVSVAGSSSVSRVDMSARLRLVRSATCWTRPRTLRHSTAQHNTTNE